MKINYGKRNHCIDCNKIIWNEFTRCKSCENVRRWKTPKLRKIYSDNGKKNINPGLGINSRFFKTGKTKSEKGYISLLIYKHPSVKGRRILEHRAVMEAYLNLISIEKWLKFAYTGNFPKNFVFLKKTQVIHHINGIKDDNRIENLMLFPNSTAHFRFRHLGENQFTCKFCKKDQRNYE